MVLFLAVVAVIGMLWLTADPHRPADNAPPASVAPSTPVVPPTPPRSNPTVVLPLEKRQAIYQLYCIRSDIVFRAWFESRPIEERTAWISKTPEDQAAMKEIWVGLNNYKICETIASALSEANYPIHLTVGDISGIAYEGRDRHWPERP